MGCIGWLAVLCGLGIGQEPPILKVDFEGPFVGVPVSAQAPGKVVGQVCPPLTENSSGWARVDMRYSRLTDKPFRGKASQRVEVREVRDGRAQAWIPLDPIPDRYHRIRFAGRSPEGGPFTIAIRMAGAPYTEPWAKTVGLTTEWNVFEMFVPPIPQAGKAPLVLMLYFQARTTDLDDISVDVVDVDKLTAGSVPKEGNLVGDSSFAVGLPSPWSIAAGPIGATVAADPTEVGPTGVRSLRLRPGFTAHTMPMVQEVAVLSPPLKLNQRRPHTVSLYLKGSSEGQRVDIGLGVAGGPMVSRSVTVAPQWKRYEATVTLPFVVEGYANLKVGSGSEFWMDGVQVEEGDHSSPFRRSGTVEFQVRPTRSFGLSVGDEALSVLSAVLGDVPKGAAIKGKLVDMRGTVRPLGPIRIGAKAGHPFEVFIPNHPAGTYGTFRIELRLFGAKGEPLTRWSEAVLHRVRPARHLNKDAPESPFGIHIDPIPSYASTVKKLGFNWVRIHDASAYVTKWYFLEKEPGVFDFSRADAGINVFRSNHLMILGMLDTAPIWRSNNRFQDWFSKYHLPRQDSLDLWANYCRTVVDRYRKEIRFWEVWNEPYVPDFFRKTDKDDRSFETGTPADYVELLKLAYRAAKEADPTCKVLWSNAVGDWAKGTSEARAFDFADIASFHNYTNLAPQAFLPFGQQIDDMRGFLPNATKAMPFWNSEGGMGSANETHILSHTAKPGNVVGAVQQADFLVRYQIASLVGGAKRFFLYTYHYHGWNDSWDLLLPDGMLPPNATAQSALMWHLEGKRYREKIPLNDVYDAYVFEGADKDVLAILARSEAGKAPRLDNLPKGAALRDLFGNDRPTPIQLDRYVWYLEVPRATVSGAEAARKVRLR